MLVEPADHFAEIVRGVRYSAEVRSFGRGRVIPSRNEPLVPVRKSTGAARATMLWTLALSRSTGSGSAGRPRPSSAPSMLTRRPPEEPMRWGVMLNRAARWRMKRTAQCTSLAGAG